MFGLFLDNNKTAIHFFFCLRHDFLQFFILIIQYNFEKDKKNNN